MVTQIVVAVFAALVIAKSYDEFRRGREPLVVFLFWLAIWSTVILIAFFPKITDFIRASILGPRAGLGTIFGIALVFLLFISYRVYLKADRIEREVNRLISDLAIKNASKRTKK